MTSEILINSGNEQILIVSDSIDEIKDVQHLLAEDFGSLLKADSESEGLHLFKTRHPLLLILAFQDIEKAEHFYLSLYRHDNNMYETPHQTLLLCKNSESERAYQLCTGGTFDDFVADRPLYEPYRLRLSVSQALKRRSQEQYAYLLNNQLEKITLGLHKFDHFIGGELTTGSKQNREAISRFHYFTKKLATDLEQLEEDLLKKTSESGLPNTNKKNLKNQFNQFRKNSLKKGSQRVIEQLDVSGSWLNGLNDGYKEYAETFPKKNNTAHVMLIDDDEFYRDTLIAMLEEEGVNIVGLADGKAAIDKLKHTKPDLILLDYQMPELNGIETLIQIKSNPETRSIPIIMLTGIHERSIVDQSIQAGAADYIVKPSDRETIMTKIHQTIQN